MEPRTLILMVMEGDKRGAGYQDELRQVVTNSDHSVRLSRGRYLFAGPGRFMTIKIAPGFCRAD